MINLSGNLTIKDVVKELEEDDSVYLLDEYDREEGEYEDLERE